MNVLHLPALNAPRSNWPRREVRWCTGFIASRAQLLASATRRTSTRAGTRPPVDIWRGYRATPRPLGPGAGRKLRRTSQARPAPCDSRAGRETAEPNNRGGSEPRTPTGSSGPAETAPTDPASRRMGTETEERGSSGSLTTPGPTLHIGPALTRETGSDDRHGRPAVPRETTAARSPRPANAERF